MGGGPPGECSLSSIRDIWELAICYGGVCWYLNTGALGSILLTRHALRMLPSISAKVPSTVALTAHRHQIVPQSKVLEPQGLKYSWHLEVNYRPSTKVCESPPWRFGVHRCSGVRDYVVWFETEQKILDFTHTEGEEAEAKYTWKPGSPN